MFSNLRKYRVIPLLKYKDLEPETAIKIAEALTAGGLSSMEINFRRHCDSKAIKEVSRTFPDFLIGASGILNKDQLLRAIDSGAKFVTSPVLCRDCLPIAAKQKITFAPGANTPNEIEQILLTGCITFQFFPAALDNGAKYLQSVLEPFEHLPLDVIVKGGINSCSVKEYSLIPQVLAIAVEDIIRPEYIAEQRWDLITEAAKNVLRLINAPN
jgi:2-dehydro-3-deoxyphosphogluconate aldolase/(4S)-4-hydroxy-2-oxoglutarate aldolase